MPKNRAYGEMRLFLGKARLEICVYRSKTDRRKKIAAWQQKYGDADGVWIKDFYVVIIPRRYPAQKSDE